MEQTNKPVKGEEVSKKSNKKRMIAGAVLTGAVAIGGLTGGFIADDSSELESVYSQIEDLKAELEMERESKLKLVDDLEVSDALFEEAVSKIDELENAEPVIEYVVEEVESEESKQRIVDLELGLEDSMKSLNEVLEHIFYNDGSVEYLTEDLKEADVDDIVDRVIFITECKELAVDFVKKELLDEVDKEVVDGVELDDKEIERLKIDSDPDEIEVIDVDFEDKDSVLRLTGTFEQDDDKFDYVVDVEFKDSEIEELDVVSLSKR